MGLDVVRRIRGNLYGSIDVTKLEDIVISHPIFQRLRRIKQTAFLSYVFPGASHTRFEHSLGVMHHASLAWTKIKANQQRLKQSSLKYPDFEERENSFAEAADHGYLYPTFSQIDKVFSSDVILQTLRLAALLHDLGHPPFSHSGERFLASMDDVLEQNSHLPAYVTDYFKKLASASRGKNSVVRHELYTIMLVYDLFSDIYSDIHYSGLRISAQDIISIIIPEISPSHDSELLSLGVHKLCHELVSGEIDIDRIDYLQRDSKECGVVYGIFDVDRILDSLALYYDKREKRLHLAIQLSGLAAFEDYLRARQSMYVQLYFHKTSVACEAMLQYLSSMVPNFKLPARTRDYVSMDESSFVTHLLDEGRRQIDDSIKLANFESTVKDLFFNRKLWKRVYELIFMSSESQNSGIDQAAKILSEHQIHFEKILSVSMLTRIKERKFKEKSQNSLRLIKKDEKQFLRVLPLEDYSSLLSNNQEVSIHRLYVKSHEAKEAKKQLIENLI